MSSAPLGLDFTQVRLTRLTDALRRLVESVVIAVLETETPGSAWQPPQVDLATLTRPGDRRQVTPSKAATGVTRTTLRGMEPEAGAIDGWWGAIWTDLDQRLEGIGPQQVTPRLWRLAAARAWHDLTHQHTLAGHMYAYLKAHTLLPMGQVPVAQVAASCGWLLLALAPLSVGPRRAPAEWLQLQQLSGQWAAGPGWAGFWEQWLVLLALRRWPRTLTRIGPPLQAPLRAWPLARLMRASLMAAELDPAERTAAHAWAVADWDTQVPGWFSAYVRQDWTLPLLEVAMFVNPDPQPR